MNRHPLHQRRRAATGIFCLTLMLVIALMGMMAHASPVDEPDPGNAINVVDAQQILEEFHPLLPQLEQDVDIPILLPSTIEATAIVNDPSGESMAYLDVPINRRGQFEQVSASLTQADEDEYTITFDAEADCNGANRCSFGYVRGNRLYTNTPSIMEFYTPFQGGDPDYQPIARSPEADDFGPVELGKGITGIFVPYVCGANCDTSKIVFDLNEALYTVGIRYASKAIVMEMANSMIVNRLPHDDENTG